MAGSIKHCLRKPRDDDYTGIPEYRGTALLENMGDMAEGVDEMMFAIGALSNGYRSPAVQEAVDRFHSCARGVEPWPAWWKPKEE